MARRGPRQTARGRQVRILWGRRQHGQVAPRSFFFFRGTILHRGSDRATAARRKAEPALSPTTARRGFGFGLPSLFAPAFPDTPGFARPFFGAFGASAL